MENKNPILNELKDISMLVAAIGNQLPYTVPPRYFDGLAMQVMLRIAIEEKAGTDPVLNINKDNLYQAPAGYFDGLAGTILNRIKAHDSADAGDEIALLSPLLKQLGKKTPFTSPEGYFNDFSDNIVAGVKAVDFVNEELENLSPVMRELKSKLVYEVPDGYFDTLPAVIVNKAKQQPARIISIGFRKIARYAAAAAVTGIIVLTGYFYFGNKHIAAATDIASATASIPDQEIESFLSNNTVALADVGTDTPDTLNTTVVDDAGAITDYTKDLLADISDEELQKYVEQHSETPITN